MITSTANPTVKRARKLRSRKYREAEGVFLIEGITHVRRAIEHGAPIETLLVAPELLKSGSAWEVIEEQRVRGSDIVELGRDAFETITSRDHPSGLAATVRIEERPLTDLSAESDSIFVAVHGIGNPGNLGSIIRTVDAIGGDGLVIVGRSTDRFHPVAVKSSMGTMFSVPIRVAATVEDLMAWCMMERIKVYTTSARAESSLWDSVIERPCIFVFGGEAEGLPPEVLDRGTPLSLPMRGSASSLNLAVAAGVFLYEAARRSAPRDL